MNLCVCVCVCVCKKTIQLFMWVISYRPSSEVSILWMMSSLSAGDTTEKAKGTKPERTTTHKALHIQFPAGESVLRWLAIWLANTDVVHYCQLTLANPNKPVYWRHTADCI